MLSRLAERGARMSLGPSCSLSAVQRLRQDGSKPPDSLRGSDLRLNNSVADGEPRDIRRRVQVELAHDRGAMAPTGLLLRSECELLLRCCGRISLARPEDLISWKWLIGPS